MAPIRSTIRIRTAKPADIPALARASYDAFPNRAMDIASREDFLRTSVRASLADRMLAERDGEHVGQATLVPFQLWLSGARFQMGGVGGVAVRPEARRAGVARALLLEGFRRMRARGDVISLLYPFRHSFYQAYGYATIAERHYYEVAPASLPLYAGRRRVRALDRGEYPRVYRCYERLLRESSCRVERDAKVWEKHFKNAELRVFGVERAKRGPELAGYFVCDSIRRDGRECFDVVECALEDESARQAMLGMLSTLRDQYAEIRLFADPDERFGQRLVEPERPIRQPVFELFYSVAGVLSFGYMGRVLDAAKALRTRNYRPADEARADFTVLDPTLPGGRSRVSLAVGPGGGRVVPAAPAGRRVGGPPRAGVEVPVDLFSQCFFGYVPWSLAARDPRLLLKGSGAVLPALDQAFRVPAATLQDIF